MININGNRSGACGPLNRRVGTYVVYAFIAMIAMSVLSCIGDNGSDEPDGPVKNGFSIVAAGRAGSLPSGDNELIGSWWMAFVDNSRTVRAVVGNELPAAVSEDDVSCDLPAGTYTIYAFANISPDELKKHTGLEFVTGKPAPDGCDTALWTGMSNYSAKDKYIPMSGRRTVKVTGRVTEPWSVEVVRMLGKVEFVFSNDSPRDITLRSMTFKPLFTGDIPLFVEKDDLTQAPSMCEGVGSVDFSIDFGKVDLPAGQPDVHHSEWFYVREAVADSHPTGHFGITVNVMRSGDTEETSRFAITAGLTFINRNDYIQIPVTFTDYEVSYDVLFYPPIGGYPAVQTEPRGEECYVTFGSSGKFAITPLVRLAGGNNPYLNPSDYTITVATTDGDGIFTSSPSYDRATGEITGELSASTGTATVRILLGISRGDLTYSYERTIYVIRV